MAHAPLTSRVLVRTAAACLIAAAASAPSARAQSTSAASASVPAASSGAGSLSRLDQGTRRYRWSRGSLGIELHDRDARWSAAEARLMADAFDVMPDVFLRKAIVVAGVNRVYRDVLPRSPSSAKPRGAVCVARKGYIGIGDSVLVQRPERVLVTPLPSREVRAGSVAPGGPGDGPTRSFSPGL